MSLKAFILEIIAVMGTDMDAMEEDKKVAAVDSDSDDEDLDTKRKESRKKRVKVSDTSRLDKEEHFARSVKCKEHDTVRNRGACRVCSKKVPTFCEKCTVFLCIDNNNVTTCFAHYHTVQKYK
jgi:hypothetical protein